MLRIPSSPGGKSTAFFVGPDGDFDLTTRTNVGLVQDLQYFQPSQHTEITVKFSAGRLGIDMRSGNDRGR